MIVLTMMISCAIHIVIDFINFVMVVNLDAVMLTLIVVSCYTYIYCIHMGMYVFSLCTYVRSHKSSYIDIIRICM